MLPAVKMINDIVKTVENYQVIKPDDMKFLQENSKHLGMIAEKTWKWRTPLQHRSIICDFNFPTVHSKFHQAILECDVQIQQTMYLAKDHELKKLEIAELECDLEELDDSKRSEIKKSKIQLEMQFKIYELKQMEIAMDYRMKEVKSWVVIQKELLEVMNKEGIDPERIWDKSEGQISAMFFQTLNNLQGVTSSNDGAEVNNLLSLARFAVHQVKQSGLYEKLKEECNSTQLNWLAQIEKL